MICRTVRSAFGVFVSAGAILASVLFAGCAGKSGAVREKTSQEWYDQGARLAGKEKYDEALEAFKEAAKGYRGADLDADIQISLADAYFNKEEYPAAVEAYTEFLRLHPHNARADYVQFRIGLSWQKSMRGADRSPEPARKAQAAFEALERGYPRSSFLAQGREGLAAARRRMAEHELGVADFYRRTEKYRAAAGRYELVLRDYADSGFTDRVLYELGRCYRQLRDQEKADQFYERLRREYPQSRFVRDLEKS
ncbi:MAG: outer membrane protein assembly factor BamD [Candidatus Methylomirabilia bacterium]